MPAAVEIVVYGEPAPRGSKVAGVTTGGQPFLRDSSKRSYPWMRDVAQAAGIAMLGRPLLEGPLKIELDFYRPRPQGHFGSGKNAGRLKASAPARPVSAPDVGKLARGTIDALEGICFRNDAQIVESLERKHYGDPARCEIRLERLEIPHAIG